MKKLFIFCLLLLAAPSALRAQDAAPAAVLTATETNRAAALKAYEAFNAQNWDALDAVVDKDLVDHQSPPGWPAGLAGLKSFSKQIAASFPDYKRSVEDIIVSGDKVVVRLTLSGTQRGDWLGIKPNGRKFSISAVDIIRFKDGKGVERWGNQDDLSMIQQLSALSAAENSDIK